MSAPLDFWFSIGSPYTFLAVMRLPQIAERAAVEIRWRPFDACAIQAEANDAPFADRPLKAAYMWRDIERQAAKFGLTIRLPITYPLTEFQQANRVAALAAGEGWCHAYATATYRRWFVDREPAGSEPNLSASIKEAGQDPARVLKQANSKTTVRVLDTATDEAREIGIFVRPPSSPMANCSGATIAWRTRSHGSTISTRGTRGSRVVRQPDALPPARARLPITTHVFSALAPNHQSTDSLPAPQAMTPRAIAAQVRWMGQPSGTVNWMTIVIASSPSAASRVAKPRIRKVGRSTSAQATRKAVAAGIGKS